LAYLQDWHFFNILKYEHLPIMQWQAEQDLPGNFVPLLSRSRVGDKCANITDLVRLLRL